MKSFARLPPGSLQSRDEGTAKIYRIPVCYGGEFGPDLGIVAGYAQMTEDEVIHHHTARTYLIYMLGFLPGFAYLGGLDSKIAAPRRRLPGQRYRRALSVSAENKRVFILSRLPAAGILSEERRCAPTILSVSRLFCIRQAMLSAFFPLMKRPFGKFPSLSAAENINVKRKTCGAMHDL